MVLEPVTVGEIPVVRGIEPVPSREEDSVAWTGLPRVLFGKSSDVREDCGGLPVPVIRGSPVPVMPKEEVGMVIDEVMFVEVVDARIVVVPSTVPVWPTSSEQEVLFVRGNGGEYVGILGGMLVPMDAVPLGPTGKVVLSRGNGAEDDGKLVGIEKPIEPVPVGPADEVLLSMGNGGADEEGVEEIAVPIAPVPVGPTVAPRDDVSLPKGNGGEEDGMSEGTEGMPVPRGAVTRGAVPVGPTVGDVVLSIGKGGKEDGMLIELPVPIGVVPVGPVDPEIEVLLSMGNGGEEDGALEGGPVPVSGITVKIESVMGVEVGAGTGAVRFGRRKVDVRIDGKRLVKPVIGITEEAPVPDGGVTVGAVTIGAVPPWPSVGPRVDVLLSIGNGGKEDTLLDEDASGIEVVLVGVQLMVLWLNAPSIIVDVITWTAEFRQRSQPSNTITYGHRLVDIGRKY